MPDGHLYAEGHRGVIRSRAPPQEPPVRRRGPTRIVSNDWVVLTSDDPTTPSLPTASWGARTPTRWWPLLRTPARPAPPTRATRPLPRRRSTRSCKRARRLGSARPPTPERDHSGAAGCGTEEEWRRQSPGVPWNDGNRLDLEPWATLRLSCCSAEHIQRRSPEFKTGPNPDGYYVRSVASEIRRYTTGRLDTYAEIRTGTIPTTLG